MGPRLMTRKGPRQTERIDPDRMLLARLKGLVYSTWACGRDHRLQSVRADLAGAGRHATYLIFEALWPPHCPVSPANARADRRSPGSSRNVALELLRARDNSGLIDGPFKLKLS